MKLPLIFAAVVLAAACVEQTQTKQPEAPRADTAAAVAVEPAAVAALQRMGAYLQTLQTFEVRMNTNVDEVAADTGQKLQFSGTTTYRVRRPNGFQIDSRTDRRHRQFFYDGRTFTVYSPRMDFYAQTQAPATIREVVEVVQDRYDISLPLSDLFYWGSPEADMSNVTQASTIGFARIGDADTTQYAFRQGDVDWQVWIQEGDRPLPRKVVITSRESEGQPQFTADLSWNLNPRLAASTFAFTPNAQARQIRFAANVENPTQ